MYEDAVQRGLTVVVLIDIKCQHEAPQFETKHINAHLCCYAHCQNKTSYRELLRTVHSLTPGADTVLKKGMAYSWAGTVQVLQEASQWCPQAEKVFVSPTGQLVDPAAAQQQVAAPHANGASQPQAPGKAVPEHAKSCLINFPSNFSIMI